MKKIFLLSLILYITSINLTNALQPIECKEKAYKDMRISTSFNTTLYNKTVILVNNYISNFKKKYEI